METWRNLTKNLQFLADCTNGRAYDDDDDENE